MILPDTTVMNYNPTSIATYYDIAKAKDMVHIIAIYHPKVFKPTDFKRQRGCVN